MTGLKSVSEYPEDSTLVTMGVDTWQAKMIEFDYRGLVIDPVPGIYHAGSCIPFDAIEALIAEYKHKLAQMDE